MQEEDLLKWESQFREFHALFRPLFHRSEPRTQALKYMEGLLNPTGRRNAWHIAEASREKIPDPTQRLLYRTEWDEEEAICILQRFNTVRIGETDGVFTIDESSIIKKGKDSCGVQKQYCGRYGKIENCQVGVYAGYASARGYALMDRRLFLPEEWCADASRRKKTKVPQEISFQTKPEIAVELLKRMRRNGVPAKWVVADSLYGDSPDFREGVEKLKLYYVVGVKKTTPVWQKRPGIVRTRRRKKGGRRPCRQWKLAAHTPAAVECGALVKKQHAQKWKTICVGEGAKGPKEYEWLRIPVVEKRRKMPGQNLWLIARRSPENRDDIRYFISNAPRKTTLQELAVLVSTRWTIEQCFEEAKGETGLAEYEARLWPCWHRHMTLSMMAHSFLLGIRQQEGKKKLIPSLPR
jgi:SRSO17 transposase